ATHTRPPFLAIRSESSSVLLPMRSRAPSMPSGEKARTTSLSFPFSIRTREAPSSVSNATLFSLLVEVKTVTPSCLAIVMAACPSADVPPRTNSTSPALIRKLAKRQLQAVQRHLLLRSNAHYH